MATDPFGYIAGWEIVNTPQPGDVAAFPRSGDSGHVGIYVGGGGAFSGNVMAANTNSVGISTTHFYNEYSNYLAGSSGDTVYRRYTGQ